MPTATKAFLIHFMAFTITTLLPIYLTVLISSNSFLPFADPAAGGGPSSDMLGPQLVSDFPTTSVKFSNATGYVLDCETRGQPPPKTRWYQLTSSGFEQEVSSVERLRTIAPNGSLVFPPFQAIQFRPDVHNVAYRCRVSNVFGLVASPVVHVTASKCPTRHLWQ